MRLPPKDERCAKPAPVAAARIGLSLIRQRIPGLAAARARLDQGGVWVHTDLMTPLGLRLYRYGFCEPEAYLLARLLRRGDVFIDGGANIGLFTLIGAATVGAHGRVLACEPSHETMTLLRANVALNGFDWVDTYEIALAERPGRLTLFGFGRGAGLSSFAPADRGGSHPREVAVTTLDELAAECFDLVRLVKLDIEGAEVRALRGAKELLAKARPFFVIELEPAHLERQGSSASDLRAIFSEADYDAYRAVRRNGSVQLSRADFYGCPGTRNPNLVLRPRERSSDTCIEVTS